MDLFPRARRALLTAYADTDAAIAAINVVDVDHYLLKPWDPPEEKLYPVVDAMIEAYARQPDVEVPETKVIGHRWSAPSFEARDFLARNAVPYRWYAVDEPEGVRGCSTRPASTPRLLPVVITPDGATLVASVDRPSSPAAVGLLDHPRHRLLRPRRRRRRTGRAGRRRLRRLRGAAHAAGRAAGHRRAGRPVVADRELPRLPRRRLRRPAHRPRAAAGHQVRRRDPHGPRRASGLHAEGRPGSLTFGDGSEVAAHAVIVATGVSYRELDAPGVASARRPRRLLRLGGHRGRCDCADQRRLHRRRRQLRRTGRGVLLPVAKSVTLVVRGDSLEASMSHYLIEQLAAIDNVSVRLCTVVDEAHGDDHLEALTLRHAPTGQHRAGRARATPSSSSAPQPRTDWLRGRPGARRARLPAHRPRPASLDGRAARGLDASTATRGRWSPASPGVFVAGDVRADSVKRVASAVGEGAMAVTLVHRYLGTP